MPEIRYIDIYEQGTGQLIGHEPYEVSDEELHQEALKQQLNDKHTLALQALQHWDLLTPSQKDVILKNLVWYALCKEGYL